MTHARRAYASFRKPVIEPCCRAVSQVGAHRLMNRAEHLQQSKNCADKGQRTRKGSAALHRPHKDPHRNGKRRGKHAS